MTTTLLPTSSTFLSSNAIPNSNCADVAAGASAVGGAVYASLPFRKRKHDNSPDMSDNDDAATSNRFGAMMQLASCALSVQGVSMTPNADVRVQTRMVASTTPTGRTPRVSKTSREQRLEQNRKAARESRLRKKAMIDDLQRSVIFYTRSNTKVRHLNQDLEQLLALAQAQVSVIENVSNGIRVESCWDPSVNTDNAMVSTAATTTINQPMSPLAPLSTSCMMADATASRTSNNSTVESTAPATTQHLIHPLVEPPSVGMGAAPSMIPQGHITTTNPSTSIAIDPMTFAFQQVMQQAMQTALQQSMVGGTAATATPTLRMNGDAPPAPDAAALQMMFWQQMASNFLMQSPVFASLMQPNPHPTVVTPAAANTATHDDAKLTTKQESTDDRPGHNNP